MLFFDTPDFLHEPHRPLATFAAALQAGVVKRLGWGF